MKYVDLKKFTEENGARPIYLFEGEEVYFHERGEAMLKSKFVQDCTLDYASFESLKGEKITRLVDAVNSFPFISEKRLVKIREFYPTEKEYELYLKELFENPPENSVLLLSNVGKGKAGTAALAKKPNVTYVDCSRSDEETIKKWIYGTCKRAGVYADGITCGKLAVYCNFDMARIAVETEKLLGYAAATNAERLTDEIVDALVYPDTEYKKYELSNALARKNYSAFMRVLTDLSARGYNETELLSTLASYFKSLYETSLCRGSDGELAAILGVKEYAARKNREQAAKFKKQDLLRYYEATYGAISSIKCGEQTPSAALKRTTAYLFFEGGNTI